MRAWCRSAGTALGSIVLSAVLITSTMAGTAASAESTLAAAPTTDDNIHLGLAFDYRIADPETLAGRVDYIWGATKGANGIYTDTYLPFDRDPTTAPLDYWKASHPDWIVYTCDRTTPAYEHGNPNVPLDITNPAVRAYQVAIALRRMDSGFHGIGFDNVRLRNEHGRCGIWSKSGDWVQLYSGQELDDRFKRDGVEWAKAIHHAIKARNPAIGISFNLGMDQGVPDLYQLLSPYLDLNYDERGFTGWGGKRATDDDWLREVKVVEYLTKQGKAISIGGIVPADSDASVTPEQVTWVLANYLLVKGSRTYTCVYPRTTDSAIYGDFVDRPEYHLPIGAPISARYRSQQVHLRNYSGGIVVVNPSSRRERVVTLPGDYEDVSGNHVQVVTLPPASAAIYLNNGSHQSTG